MFKIAVINHGELSTSDYIENLEKKKNRIYLFDNVELVEKLDEMDAIIIEESNSVKDFGQTCEAIIKIREQTKKFIWVLSKESTKINRLVYLRLGCDRTFDETVDSEEFVLTITLFLERRGGGMDLVTPKEQVVVADGFQSSPIIQLIPDSFSVNIAGKGEINLTKLQYEIFNLLYERRGEIISYEELYKRIWDGEEKDKHYRVGNLIFLLRKKMESGLYPHGQIKTVRSKGYMLLL